MVEFVVQIFAVTVVTIMIVAVLGAGLLIFIKPDYEAGPLINSITDIMNTIIGALIGFIAGRGALRLAEEEKKEAEERKRLEEEKAAEEERKRAEKEIGRGPS